jgi:hypothetical protein
VQQGLLRYGVSENQDAIYYNKTTELVHVATVLIIMSVCLPAELANMQSAFSVICYLPWRVSVYHIFPLNHIKGMIFGKKPLNAKYVFGISLQISYEIFHILRRIQRDMVINVYVSSSKVPVMLVRS